jgi:hypothetical protein
LHSLRFYVA